MKLANFQIDKDAIGIIHEGIYIDIHNNFEFVSYHYDVLLRQMKFSWRRSAEKWAINETLSGFALLFLDVIFLKMRERDSTLSFDEDTCLSLIGFLPQDMRDDFESYVELKNVTDTDDMTLLFQSDQAFKINCSEVFFVNLTDMK